MKTMTMIKNLFSGRQCFFVLRVQGQDFAQTKAARKSQITNCKAQSGMTLIAVMVIMTLSAIALLAVAPTIQQSVQREKELEAIRRGEEVAEAVRQYVEFYRGAKLPNSMDDLLEGLPQGTKKRRILRPSAAIDPLSEDGKWRLIKPDSKAFLNFGMRIQTYNNGLLPPSPEPRALFDRYARPLVNIINSKTKEELTKSEDEEIEIVTDSTPFIGVASQSRSASVVAYYGLENHSKWIFTPLFRGSGMGTSGGSVTGIPPEKKPAGTREMINANSPVKTPLE